LSFYRCEMTTIYFINLVILSQGVVNWSLNPQCSPCICRQLYTYRACKWVMIHGETPQRNAPFPWPILHINTGYHGWHSKGNPFNARWIWHLQWETGSNRRTTTNWRIRISRHVWCQRYPWEIWELKSRPNHNTSGRTVHRATGRGDTFRDWVYTLIIQVYPDLLNDPILLQSLALSAFLKGLRDRNAAQEAMTFRDPKSIQEAVVTITHIQGAARIFGNRRVRANCSFENRPITEATPSIGMDVLQGIDRQLRGRHRLAYSSYSRNPNKYPVYATHAEPQ